MSPKLVNKQQVPTKPTELTAFSLILELEGRSVWDLSSALCVLSSSALQCTPAFCLLELLGESFCSVQRVSWKGVEYAHVWTVRKQDFSLFSHLKAKMVSTWSMDEALVPFWEMSELLKLWPLWGTFNVARLTLRSTLKKEDSKPFRDHRMHPFTDTQKLLKDKWLQKELWKHPYSVQIKILGPSEHVTLT